MFKESNRIDYIVKETLLIKHIPNSLHYVLTITHQSNWRQAHRHFTYETSNAFDMFVAFNLSDMLCYHLCVKLQIKLAIPSVRESRALVIF